MCVSAGAPKKPEYGPCRETHGMRIMPGQYYYYPTATTSYASSSTDDTTSATWTDTVTTNASTTGA